MSKITNLVVMIVLAGTLGVGWGASVQAETTACTPADPKPTKLETRLGAIAIDTDIVAVGQTMTVVVKNGGPAQSVNIAIPSNVKVVDYFPKTLDGVQISEGKWAAGQNQVLAGEYTLMLKPTHWTAGQWQKVSYDIIGSQGMGTGSDSYFAYYDKVDFTLALDDRNQVAQTTKQVVRKVTVKAAPDIRVNLTTDRGSIGANVSEKRGNQATVTASSGGQAVFYLTANEGDRVKLTASTPDSCSVSALTEDFTVGKSDVARSYQEPWLARYWWVGLLLLLLLLIGVGLYVLTRKRGDSEPPVVPPSPPDLPTQSPPPTGM